MGKMDNETASKEFQRFAGALKLTPLKLKKFEEEGEKESLISCIEEGIVLIQDNGDVEYTLQFPLKDDNDSIVLEKITFKARRVRVEDLEKSMVGKTDLEKVRRMMSFLNGTNSALLKKLDADDFKVCSDIAAFFLPR